MSNRHDSMYIVVSNKDSIGLYSGNNMSNFKVKLPRRLEVNSDWEVACVRFSYTQSLCTFNKPQSVYMVNTATGEREVKLLIAPQRFLTVEHLMNVINATIKQEIEIGTGDRLPGLVMDRHSRVYVYKGQINKKRYHAEFSEGLSLILGLERSGFHYLDAFKTDLYLYMDCVSQRVVGDAFVPLLTTIDIGNMKSKPGEQTIVHIRRPEYTKVAHSGIDEIEIQILDDTGSPPLFDFGSVTVSLHFRKRK